MTDLPSPSSNARNKRTRRHPGGGLARALIIMFSGFLPLGLTLPAVETTRLWVFKDSYSLLETVNGLAENGEIWLAVLIGFFSFVTPILKHMLVLWLHLGGGDRNSTLAHWVERLGKWSLTDVLVIAVLIVVWSGTGLEMTTQPGLWFFALSAIMLMIASGLVVRDLREPEQGAETWEENGRSDRI